MYFRIIFQNCKLIIFSISPFLQVPFWLHSPGQVIDKILSTTETPLFSVVFWNVLFWESSLKQSAFSPSLEAVAQVVEFVNWNNDEAIYLEPWYIYKESIVWLLSFCTWCWGLSEQVKCSVLDVLIVHHRERLHIAEYVLIVFAF